VPGRRTRLWAWSALGLAGSVLVAVAAPRALADGVVGWWYHPAFPGSRTAGVHMVWLGMAAMSVAWLALWRETPGRRAALAIAAVWLVRRVAGPDIVEEICQFERVGGSWRYLGCGGRRGELLLTGRPSASRAGPASLMTSLSGCSVRSSADRAARGRPGDFADVGWVACAMFRVGVEVAYLQAGARRVEVPWHGYVVVAWKASPVSEVPARPPVAAIGEDGSRITGLGPRDSLDSLTWAAVEAAIEGN